jgi:hypothetical protein
VVLPAAWAASQRVRRRGAEPGARALLARVDRAPVMDGCWYSYCAFCHKSISADTAAGVYRVGEEHRRRHLIEAAERICRHLIEAAERSWETKTPRP